MTTVDKTTKRQSLIRRAVMYIRVEANTPEARAASHNFQRMICQEIAERHGLRVVREFVDFGRSGRLIDQSGLRQLLDDLDRQKETTVVFVCDYPLLGKSSKQFKAALRRITASNTVLITITALAAHASPPLDKIPGSVRTNPALSDQEVPLA